MTPTPKDRFRGALMGSLLGPIYALNHPLNRPAQAQLILSINASTTSLTESIVAGERLPQYWETLADAVRVLLRPLPGGQQPLSGGQQEEKEAKAELHLLRRLPWLLLDSDWLLNDASLAQDLLKLEMWPGGEIGEIGNWKSLLLELEPYLSQAPHHWDWTLTHWLLSQTQKQSHHNGSQQQWVEWNRTSVGCQLLALFWGARQGARSIPWTTQTQLGTLHPELLQLSDRLYCTWTGQANFEEPSVSWEGSLPMASQISSI